MPHKTMSYGDGSSLKAKPPRKPKPKIKRAPPKAKTQPRPKPSPRPKVSTVKTKPPKGRTTHTGSITQLGKGTRSQLRAIGYLETPATPKPRK